LIIFTLSLIPEFLVLALIAHLLIMTTKDEASKKEALISKLLKKGIKRNQEHRSLCLN
jgi:hypothetical protein